MSSTLGGLVRFDWAVTVHSCMSFKCGAALGTQPISSFHIPGMVVGLQKDNTSVLKRGGRIFGLIQPMTFKTN